MITPMMQQVIDTISELPAKQQDELAAIIQEELEDERRWDELFADPRSDAVLARLAAEARAEYERGETEPLDPEQIR